MQNIFIHFYGAGNAWPVLIESEHPFYNRKKSNDLSNSSFSLIKSNSYKLSRKNIQWEILIDAGHGVPQYILQNHNRIPDAIVLTHVHLDHTVGLDWIVQSYIRARSGKPYPVYATKLSSEYIKQSFPHLDGLIEWKQISFGKKIKIDEANQLSLISFPVYHGQRARGACLLFFEMKGEINKKVICTGDILCPLLREQDIEIIKETDFLIADANNRFSFPQSNHWSIVNYLPNNNENKFLTDWMNEISINSLISTNLEFENEDSIKFFDVLSNEMEKKLDLILSIFDFIKIIRPKRVALTHYSGKEDEIYHKEKIISRIQLMKWIETEAKKNKILSDFYLPKTGDRFVL
ncbi:MAG: MBL fold metallo-hydrolase [Bacteroidales bacterium]|nr:MBL fold metallo-hydrolase [Bacteroidales bacterium]